MAEIDIGGIELSSMLSEITAFEKEVINAAIMWTKQRNRYACDRLTSAVQELEEYRRQVG